MVTHDSAGERVTADGDVLPSARTLGKGLAVLRVFMGVVLFANGRGEAVRVPQDRGRPVRRQPDRQGGSALDPAERVRGRAGAQHPGAAARHGADGRQLGLRRLGPDLHRAVVGGLLIVGAATRAAALVALGQALFLALVFATRNRWAFEQPHEYVPLIILAIVPAGRVWGVDGRILRRRRTAIGELRGWPF